MAAPPSTPRDHHLVRDPRKQTATARSKEKASFKCIQRKTSEKLRSHVIKKTISQLLQKHISLTAQQSINGKTVE